MRPVNREVTAKSAEALAHVLNSGISTVEIRDVSPPEVGGRYSWREGNPKPGLVMFAIALPVEFTLSQPDPLPEEAKDFQHRICASMAATYNRLRSVNSLESEEPRY